MEQRKTSRIRRRISCEFRSDGQRYQGIVTDLSDSGLFVQTDATLAVGAEVELRFTETTAFPALELRAVVVRRQRVPSWLAVVARRGLGFRIREAPEAFYAALTHFDPAADMDGFEVEIEFEHEEHATAAENAPPPTSSTAIEEAATPPEDSRDPAAPDAENPQSLGSGAAGDEGERDPEASEPSIDAELPVSADLEASDSPASPAQADPDLPASATPLGSIPIAQRWELEGESGGTNDAPSREAGLRTADLAIVSSGSVRGSASEPEPRTEPGVLLIHDGELDDVEAMLRELGEDPQPWPASEPLAFQQWERPPRLVLVTARRALSLRLPANAHELGTVTIAVAQDDSRTLCAMLRRLGFQYVVRRPVHPEALRLLFLRALFRAGNRRKRQRIPFGTEVRWRKGWRWKRGPMVEISSGGCRILAPSVEKCGARIRIRIPKEAADGRELALAGRIVRCDRQRLSTAPGQVALAVEFEALSSKLANRLATLLERNALGPLRLPGFERSEPDVVGADAPVEKCEATFAIQRRSARCSLHNQEVVALDEETDRVMHVLVGKDLSSGGIRVESHPLIQIGDRLRIALYDAAQPEPVVVEAIASRDDGPRGVVLVFENLDPDRDRALARMIGTLPGIQACRETEGQDLVVTEILARCAAA